jgi:hypothetical protein
MSSEVDISNTALSHIGDEAIVASINPPDGSVQAGHCARWYPIARDELLEMHNWRFALRRGGLALSPLVPPVGWAYAYQVPADCVQPIAVLMPTALPDLYSTQINVITPTGSDTTNAQDFTVESSSGDGTAVLYTNVDQATLLYKVAITDAAKFTPLFRAALARLLASYLAGPVIKGTTGMQVSKAHRQMFDKIDFPAACMSDSNARKAEPYTSSTPAPIAARQ